MLPRLSFIIFPFCRFSFRFRFVALSIIFSLKTKATFRNGMKQKHAWVGRSPVCWEVNALFTLSPALRYERMCWEGAGYPVYRGNRSACKRMWFRPDVPLSLVSSPSTVSMTGILKLLRANDKYLKGWFDFCGVMDMGEALCRRWKSLFRVGLCIFLSP